VLSSHKVFTAQEQPVSISHKGMAGLSRPTLAERGLTHGPYFIWHLLFVTSCCYSATHVGGWVVCGSTISKPTGSNKAVFVISKNDPVLSFVYIFGCCIYFASFIRSRTQNDLKEYVLFIKEHLHVARHHYVDETCWVMFLFDTIKQKEWLGLFISSTYSHRLIYKK